MASSADAEGKSRPETRREIYGRSIYRPNGERTSDYRRLKSADVPIGSAMRLRGHYRKAIFSGRWTSGLCQGGGFLPVFLFLFLSFFFNKSVKS